MIGSHMQHTILLLFFLATSSSPPDRETGRLGGDPAILRSVRQEIPVALGGSLVCAARKSVMVSQSKREGFYAAPRLCLRGGMPVVPSRLNVRITKRRQQREAVKAVSKGGDKKSSKAGGSCRQGELYEDVAMALEMHDKKRGTIKGLCLRDAVRRKGAATALASRTLLLQEDLDAVLSTAGLSAEPAAITGLPTSPSNSWSKWCLRAIACDRLFGGAAVARRAKHGGVQECMRSVRKAHRELAGALAEHLERLREPDAASLLRRRTDKMGTKHPRYLRVNTLRITVDEAIQELSLLGYRLVSSPGEVLQGSTQGGDGLGVMCKDPILSDVIVLPPGADLHESMLIKQGNAIVQDWASCVPAHALSLHGKRRFNTVIDCCAAPGNKATHLQALALEGAGVGKGNGIVLAVERDAKRADILRSTLQKMGARAVRVVHTDWLKLDPSGSPQCHAEAILVDPSCSGSGIHAQGQEDGERLRALAGFQAATLRRALSYAKVQVVVYSTCSVNIQENEEVVRGALAEFSADFELECCLPEWPHRGLGSFPESKMCVRTEAKRDSTQGFFVACFVRKAPASPDSKGREKQQHKLQR